MELNDEEIIKKDTKTVIKSGKFVKAAKLTLLTLTAAGALTLGAGLVTSMTGAAFGVSAETQIKNDIASWRNSSDYSDYKKETINAAYLDYKSGKIDAATLQKQIAYVNTKEYVIDYARSLDNTDVKKALNKYDEQIEKGNRLLTIGGLTVMGGMASLATMMGVNSTIKMLKEYKKSKEHNEESASNNEESLGL